jgi:plasmid stabilization system protein ParE
VKRSVGELFGILVLILAWLAVVGIASLSTGCAAMDGLYRSEAVVDPVTGEVRPGELEMSPLIVHAIRGVGQLPVPGAAAGALALGWLYSGYAAARNKRAALAVIQGIEAGRRGLQDTPEGKAMDDKIRQALIEHQQFRGVLEYVAALVQKYTEETKT